MVIACLIMPNMMSEEQLENGNEFSGEYFDGNNDYEMDEVGNVLNEAEKFVHMMEVKMSHSLHIDPRTQFLQDHIDF